MNRPVGRNTRVRYRAGLVSRLIAGAIDLVTVLVVSLTVAVVIALIRSLLLGSQFRLPDLPGWLAVSAPSLLSVGYLAGCWYATGRTPGMQLVALRVVDRRGTPLQPGQALLRAVLCVVFPIGLLWVMVSRRNLSIHDIIAGTAVIYDSSYGLLYMIR